MADFIEQLVSVELMPGLLYDKTNDWLKFGFRAKPDKETFLGLADDFLQSLRTLTGRDYAYDEGNTGLYMLPKIVFHIAGTRLPDAGYEMTPQIINRALIMRHLINDDLRMMHDYFESLKGRRENKGLYACDAFSRINF